jgi:hypothetical protein
VLRNRQSQSRRRSCLYTPAADAYFTASLSRPTFAPPVSRRSERKQPILGQGNKPRHCVSHAPALTGARSRPLTSPASHRTVWASVSDGGAHVFKTVLKRPGASLKDPFDARRKSPDANRSRATNRNNRASIFGRRGSIASHASDHRPALSACRKPIAGDRPAAAI